MCNEPNLYFCFWLNLYNFLTIFSLIYKCEIPTNYYEWYRFLKNSYFTIGNLEISLFEIENFILRSVDIGKKIYGSVKKSKDLVLPEMNFDSIINFGISIPTISSPCLRIFFPFNFINNLKLNAIEFFERNIHIDFENQKIEMPELLFWIDEKFYENLNKYEGLLPKEFMNFINKNDKLDKTINKFDWKLNYANFKNNQNIY